MRFQVTGGGAGALQRASSPGKSSRARATDRSLSALLTMMPRQASLASAMVRSVRASTSALNRSGERRRKAGRSAQAASMRPPWGRSTMAHEACPSRTTTVPPGAAPSILPMTITPRRAPTNASRKRSKFAASVAASACSRQRSIRSERGVELWLMAHRTTPRLPPARPAAPRIV